MQYKANSPEDYINQLPDDRQEPIKKLRAIIKKNIPKGKPVIFAINHQNALMDALTARAAMKGQPVFMTRADIFKKPAIAKILRFFKS